MEAGGRYRASCVRKPRARSATFPYEMNLRLVARCSLRVAYPRHTRSFFGLFKRKAQPFPEPKPLLSEDNLFHPFSKSPFPPIRARGEAIKELAPCPVCSSSHEHAHAHTKPQAEPVSFECPDCGWPTHCSEEHWAADPEHQKYCSRLREVNEDEHDLRSGRKLHEFDLPGTTSILRCEVLDSLTGVTGPQDVETAISFANWDVFWYTRGYPSMNTERSRRHSSKLLTYPITIGSVLHQFSGLTLSNQRLTSEGSRSLAGKAYGIYSRTSWLTSRLQPSGQLCMSSQVHPRRKSRAPISRDRKSVV